MKKVFLMLALATFVFSCGKDEEPAATCLVCQGDTDEESITADDGFCVGADDGDGGTITLEQIEATRDLLVAFGADCKIQ